MIDIERLIEIIDFLLNTLRKKLTCFNRDFLSIRVKHFDCDKFGSLSWASDL